METTKTFILECSRINGENIDITKDAKSSENAVWTNQVDFNFQPGDLVNMENAVIHNIGEGDGTVQLTGITHDVSGICDNIIGMRFSNYLCDNGYMTLKLPYCGSTRWKVNTITDGATPIYVIESLDTVTFVGSWAVGDTFYVDTDTTKTGIILSVVTDGGLPGAWVYPTSFSISGTDYWIDWFEDNVGASGIRFTKTDGTVWASIFEIYTSTEFPEPNLVDLDALPYIGVTVRQVLLNNNQMEVAYGMPLDEDGYNFRFAFSQNSTPQITDPSNMYTSYAFPISETNGNNNFCVNGEKYTKLQIDYVGPYRNSGSTVANMNFTSDTDILLPFYSDIIVELPAPLYESPVVITNSINEQFHSTNALNQAENNSIIPMGNDNQIIPHVSGKLNKIIECGGNAHNFWSELAVRDLNAWKGIHAMMRCDLAFEGNMRFEDQNEYLIPRPAIFLDGTKCRCKLYNEANVIDTGAFPRTRRPFSISTNHGAYSTDIYYSTLVKYFTVTTNIKYNAENINRIKIWFENNEKYNGDITDPVKAQADIENWSVNSDLGSSLDGVNTTNTRASTEDYNPSAHKYRRLTTGSPDIGLGGSYQPVSALAYSLPINPYDINSIVSNLGNNIVSPRTDIAMNGLKITTEIESIDIEVTEDVPIRFKDNTSGGCRLTLFSRLLDDYEDKMLIDNNGGLAEADWLEGDGGYKYDFLKYGVSTNLSGNLGVYGVNVVNEDDVYADYWDLEPHGIFTYWKATYSESTDTAVHQVIDYVYFIADVTDTTDDRYSHGGYLMKMYNWNKGFDDLTDCYIYSSHNINYKASHVTAIANARFNNVPFNNATNIDLFLFYTSDDYIWLGEVLDDKNGYKRLKITPQDSMPLQTSDKNDHRPFRFYEKALPGVSLKENWQQILNMYIYTSISPSPTSVPTSYLHYETDNKYKVTNQNLELNKENSELVCSFMVYRDGAVRKIDGSWEIQEDYSLPAMYQSLFLGLSPSFLDNPVVWCINPMSLNENRIDASGNVQKHMSIGANDPTCEFDATQSRTIFKNLHTQRKLGINEMPSDDNGDFITDSLGEEAIKFSDKSFLYQRFDNLELNTLHNDFQYKSPINNGISTTVSGLFLTDIYGQKQGDAMTSVDNMIGISSENTFFNSLLYKLGFKISDLFVDYGYSWNPHTVSLQGNMTKANRYKQVKPLTTNAFYSIASQQNFSLQDSSVSGGLGKPTYQLGLPGNTEFSIDGSVSTQIVASNLPIKLDNPFFQIYSDIVPSDYYTDKKKLNIVGIVPKNYISADYIYGFATNYTLPILFPSKIHSINVEVRLPDGSLAPINSKSSVLFKVQRQIAYADIQQVSIDIVKQLNDGKLKV